MQIDIAREDTNAALTFAGWGAVVIISLVLIGLAALGGSIYVIVLQVVRPLQSMTNVMTSLAGGQNRIEVLGHDRTDEIGEMARAVLVFCTAAVTQEQAAAEKAAADVEQQRVVPILAWNLAAISAGDFTSEIKETFPASYEQLRSDFNNTACSLSNLLSSVAITTGSICTGVDEIARASEDLARRTESNAASLEETSAAIVQIDAHINAAA